MDLVALLYATLQQFLRMSDATTTTILIQAPVQRVWDIFMDPGYLQFWLTNFVSIEPLEGLPGEPGSTSRLIVNERGREIVVIEKVVDMVPQEFYAFTMTNPDFEAINELRFTTEASGTLITQTSQFLPKGFFMKMMMPMLKGEMKKRMSNELQKLKQVIENSDR